MKVKLKDVAEAAGVSVSTVSRVINGDREKPASPETVEKIWKYVKELGYVPNKAAKNLVTGADEADHAAGRIGCIYTSTFNLNNDPFFSCIGLGIQKQMNLSDYTMAYALSAAHMDYKEIYSYIISHPADGIIVMGRFEESILTMLKDQFKHMVYAGVNEINGGFDEVICDGYDGAKTALKHLIDMGHSKIGYIGYIHEKASDELLLNEHRYKAYLDMMNDRAFEIDDSCMIHTKLRTTEAYGKMMDYLDKHVKEEMPTAFYCANDATAFGVMRALKDKGFRIPEDVAVIGLDNVEMASFFTPRLSTISIPQRALGMQAVKMLVEQLEGKREYPMKVNLPFELIVRESSDYRR